MRGVVKATPGDVRVEDRPEPHIPKPTDTHQRRAVKVRLRP
jgi:threonine dehydrogenase-like Zn-dependent dehydrogenase